jgi:hypothetical protein
MSGGTSWLVQSVASTAMAPEAAPTISSIEPKAAQAMAHSRVMDTREIVSALEMMSKMDAMTATVSKIITEENFGAIFEFEKYRKKKCFFFGWGC